MVLPLGRKQARKCSGQNYKSWFRPRKLIELPPHRTELWHHGTHRLRAPRPRLLRHVDAHGQSIVVRHQEDQR